MLCAVYGCLSNNKESSLHFFRFPSDPVLREIWVKFCDREDKFNTKTSRICGNHFRKEDLERNFMYELGINKRYIPTLKRGTYPTVKHTEDTLTPVVCEPLKPIVSLTIEPDLRPPLNSEPSGLDPLSEECASYNYDEESVSDSVTDSALSPTPFATQVTAAESAKGNVKTESPFTTSNVPSICSAPTITTVSAYVPEVCATHVPSSISCESLPHKPTLSEKLHRIKEALRSTNTEPEVTPPTNVPTPPPPDSSSNSKIQDLLRENFTLKLKQENMEKQMKRLKTKLFQAQTELQTINNRLKEVFTAGQVKKLKTGEKRLCWSETDIVRSVTLYSTSPTAYRLLLRQKFPLPAIRTVQDWTKKIDNSLQATQSTEVVGEDVSPSDQLIQVENNDMQVVKVEVEDQENEVCNVKQEVIEADDDGVKPADEDYVQVVKLRELNKRRRGRIPTVGRVQKTKIQKPKAEGQKGVQSKKDSNGRRSAKLRENEKDSFVNLEELDNLDFILYDPDEDFA